MCIGTGVGGDTPKCIIKLVDGILILLRQSKSYFGSFYFVLGYFTNS